MLVLTICARSHFLKILMACGAYRETEAEWGRRSSMLTGLKGADVEFPEVSYLPCMSDCGVQLSGARSQAHSHDMRWEAFPPNSDGLWRVS